MRPRAKLCGFVAVVVLVLIIVWQHQTISKLRREVAQLQSQATQNTSSQSALTITGPSEKDLERIRTEHAELLRLRGEVTRLKQQSVSSEPEVSEKRPMNADATRPLSTNDFVVSSTNLTIPDLKSSETLVAGGLDLADGKKGYALVTPTFIDAAGNVLPVGTPGSQITLETQIVSISPEDLDEDITARLALNRLSATDLRLLLALLNNKQSFDIVTPPNVTTLIGRQAQVSVLDLHTAVDPVIVNGQTQLQTQNIATGPMIDVLPRLAQDGTSISVTVNAQLTTIKPK